MRQKKTKTPETAQTSAPPAQAGVSASDPTKPGLPVRADASAVQPAKPALPPQGGAA